MMKLRPKLLTLLLATCLISLQAFGQNAVQKAKIVSKSNVVELRQLQQKLGKSYQANYAKALRMAKAKGWPVEKKLDNGSIVFLYGVNQFEKPIYVTSTNLDAAITTSTNEIQEGGSTGLDLTGEGMTIGMWEVGTTRLTHQEYNGRIAQVDNSGSPPLSSHANHVAGTLIAEGVNPDARGMATNGFVDAYTADNDEAEMAAAAADGLLLSNHSYGFITGWTFGLFGDNRWVWFGDTPISETEDYRFGAYTQTTQEWDMVGYNAPTYLIVKSAGNDRLEGPAPGTEHWFFDYELGDWALSTTPRDLDGGPDGYDAIGEQSVAKNILTVGAVDDIAAGYSNRTDVRMSSFSSWGPTDDGRIKPDIVANGVNLFSSIATSNTAYASYSGTSMSGPNAAGTLLLLQEHYNNMNGSFMLAATLKGLAIHSADEAGLNPGPDYAFGHGLLNAEKAAEVISENNVSSYIKEEVLEDGASYTFEFKYDGSQPLVGTISWTDLPAELSDDLPVVDDATIRLVNDLDVRISNGSMTYEPWILDPANPSAAAMSGDNIRDNVEKIFIANAPAGTYTVTVTHKGSIEGGSQPFSLIIGGENLPSRAIISVSPEMIQEMLNVGETSTRSLVIENSGNVDLTYSLGIRLGASDTTEVGEFLKDRASLVGEGLATKTNAVERLVGQTGTSGVVAPSEVALGSVILTHSESQEVVAGNSIQCGSGTGATRVQADNSYWRAFDLENFGVTGNFNVDSVQFGVQLATSGSEAGQPIIIRLYTTNGEFPGTPLTLIGSTLYTLPDQSLSIASVPVNATAFSGTTLVVEIFTPDGGSGPNSFFIGSNGFGETAPSYQSFPACGVSTPTPMIAFGYDDIHFVMNVVGNESASWLTVTPDADTVEVGGSSMVNLNFDATGLEPGNYFAELVVSSSDYENPEVIVPIHLTVEGDSTSKMLITGFLLINADDNTVIGPIEDGDTINLSNLPTENVNVIAETDDSVNRVKFTLSSGNKSKSRVDNFAPYSVFGDKGGEFNGVTPLERSYSLTAVPYVDNAEAEGKTISFEVTKSDEEVEQLVAYPNPFTDAISVKFPKQYYGAVKVSLMDQYGRKVVLGNLKVTEEESVVTFDVTRYKLQPSTEYFLKIESKNNKPEIIRLIKSN